MHDVFRDPRDAHVWNCACGRVLPDQADGQEGQAACDALGVDVLPTVQYWREGRKLWEHRGIVQLDQSLGEGA